MAKNNFLTNEPLILKIFYWIGIICFIIYLFKLPIFNNRLDKLFAIVGYGGLFLFFIRSFIYNRKNRID
jgi:hypothetical protein